MLYNKKFIYQSAEQANLQGIDRRKGRTKDRIESGLSCPSWDQEGEVFEILALSWSLTTNLRQHSDTSFYLIYATTYFEVLETLPGEKEERN